MTGWRLTSSVPAMMRSLSSFFEVTRMWRRTERANFGEEALDEVEPGAVLGREGKFEAAGRSCIEPGSGLSRDLGGMIVEDQLDRGAGRIGGIGKLEEFDELSAAVAVFDESVDLPGPQIDSSQQAERAMTPIPKIARWKQEGRRVAMTTAYDAVSARIGGG